MEQLSNTHRPLRALWASGLIACPVVILAVLLVAWWTGRDARLPQHPEVRWLGWVPVERGMPESMAFSPHGQLLAVATKDTESNSGGIAVWNTVDLSTSWAWQIPGWFVSSLSFSPDGQSLVCGVFRDGMPAWDTSLRLFDVPSGMEKERFDFGNGNSVIVSLAFTPDGQSVAVLEAARVLRLWDVARWRELTALTVEDAGGNCVAFSPNGDTLAAAMDRKLKILNVQSRKWRATLADDLYGVVSVAFSPDGGTLAAIVNDRTVKLWDMQTCKLKGTVDTSFDCAEFVSFTQASNKLITFGTNAWWAKPATSRGTSRIPYRSRQPSDWEGTVVLRSLKKGFPATNLVGPTTDAQFVAFCAARMLLATASRDRDGLIGLWDISDVTD